MHLAAEVLLDAREVRVEQALRSGEADLEVDGERRCTVRELHRHARWLYRAHRVFQPLALFGRQLIVVEQDCDQAGLRVVHVGEDAFARDRGLYCTQRAALRTGQEALGPRAQLFVGFVAVQTRAGRAVGHRLDAGDRLGQQGEARGEHGLVGLHQVACAPLGGGLTVRQGDVGQRLVLDGAVGGEHARAGGHQDLAACVLRRVSSSSATLRPAFTRCSPSTATT